MLGVFDNDGTLTDSARFYFGAINFVLETFNVKPVSFRAFSREITGNIPGFYYDHGLPKSVRVGEIERLRNTYIRDYWTDYRLMDHARELLRSCRKLGVKNIVVSHNDSWIMKRGFQKHKVDGLLDRVISTQNKERVLRKLKRQANGDGIFFVGDTSRDVEAGRKAGVTTIGFLKGLEPEDMVRAAKPDFEAETLGEVQKIIVSLVKARG